MKEEKMRQKLMLMPLNKLEKKADTAFQLMRRMEEANDQGVVRCITCGVFGSYWTFDAGHYIQREHKGVRHERLNVWPQCKRCNGWKGGRYALYRDKLIEKIGRNGVEVLEAEKDKPMHGPGTSYRDWCIEVFLMAKKEIKFQGKRLAGLK